MPLLRFPTFAPCVNFLGSVDSLSTAFLTNIHILRLVIASYFRCMAWC
ncbi:hypothetical protein LINGRAPRIM_LOCUS612 [Linum grandiflorum]